MAADQLISTFVYYFALDRLVTDRLRFLSIISTRDNQYASLTHLLQHSNIQTSRESVSILEWHRLKLLTTAKILLPVAFAFVNTITRLDDLSSYPAPTVCAFLVLR